MKNKLLLLFTLISTLSYAQTYTYDWSSVSFNGSISVSQNVAGVQAECTNSSNTVEVLNGGGYAGSNGNIITSTGNVNSMTVTFSDPINVQSIFAFDGNGVAGNWTFWPAGGTNSNVTQSIAASVGSTINVGWTNVTSFTITKSNGVARFSIDDIVFSIPVCSDVNIPDANFKTYLIGNSNINTNGDNEIQCTEASSFNGDMFLNALNISDLTGIEQFPLLNTLRCKNNNLTTIDVSSNTNLTLLDCSNNLLTTLDVTSNVDLAVLRCHYNSLSTINTSFNSDLTELSCVSNNLTGLDLTNNLDLYSLNFAQNALTTLDVSFNTSLNILACMDNSITNLDVSLNTGLGFLNCENNELSALNVANGNNSDIFGGVNALGNSNLNCIQIDTGFTPTANWQKDAAATYSDNCPTLSVANFELAHVALYPNPTTSVLNIKTKGNLKQATIYSVLGVKILETASKNITTLNLKSGMYLISIEDENGSISTKRFIKN
ncbi:T9SS type A sorting domain-containing protein [Lacinutrix sp. Bg11-31]|uniref:T9SS type A sorting domain-containing protein n=1 Tax=Lacinutrix sp. Bg11-31 TaxID=2057808 RepID=UPI000C30814D|nr:T9SS type A sorting domain-containing protein [Lacinutrix sp. Bg11-31]AUC83474.1 hypothetical protein CW733_15575 [Lacinutrix sp. Bg11-31]